MNIFSSLGSSEGADERYFSKGFHFLLNRILHTDEMEGKKLLGEICFTNFEQDEYVSVQREFEIPTKEGWVDLRVRGRKKQFYIELKLDSKLGEDQIYRYKRALDTQTDIPKKDRRVILISKWQLDYDERNTPDIEWRWFQIFRILENCEVADEVTKEYAGAFGGFMEELGMNIKKVTWEFIGGVQALLDLRTMIEAVLKDIDSKIEVTFSSGASYENFNIQKPSTLVKHRIGIEYEYLDTLYYYIPRKADESILEDTAFGLDGGCPCAEMSLRKERFFCLSKEEQFERVSEFLKQSIRDAKRIVKKQ